MRTLLPAFFLSAILLSGQQSEEDFSVSEKYYNDSLGSRLVIRPEVRKDSVAADLELRIFDETYYDPGQSKFVLREVATIQGGGLGYPGLLFYTRNSESRETMIQLLEEFLAKAEKFNLSEEDIKDLAEPWMGNPEAALSQSRPLSRIQTDFIRRPADVTLNWNLKTNRIWISLNDFVNIDSRVAETLLNLVRNIPTYSNQRETYQSEIARRNEEINKSLELSSE